MKSIFDGLDFEIKVDLVNQLSVLWTHDSTAIEGNTLTLGETDFLIREGLLASNRPLKDCMEVKCHYDAVKHLFDNMLSADREILCTDIEQLHKIMMPASFCSPETLGTWKRQTNATNSIDGNGKPFILLYPLPQEIPSLMNCFIKELNRFYDTAETALDAYCSLHLKFVSIHPFADGNGRMARLLANIPLMRIGALPVIIPSASRQRYINLIRQAQCSEPVKEISGKPLRKMVIPQRFDCSEFKVFCNQQQQTIQDIVQAAHELQRIKNDNAITL